MPQRGDYRTARGWWQFSIEQPRSVDADAGHANFIKATPGNGGLGGRRKGSKDKLTRDDVEGLFADIVRVDPRELFRKADGGNGNGGDGGNGL
jgi:hypothetical protein